MWHKAVTFEIYLERKVAWLHHLIDYEIMLQDSNRKKSRPSKTSWASCEAKRSLKKRNTKKEVKDNGGVRESEGEEWSKKEERPQCLRTSP